MLFFKRDRFYPEDYAVIIRVTNNGGLLYNLFIVIKEQKSEGVFFELNQDTAFSVVQDSVYIAEDSRPEVVGSLLKGIHERLPGDKTVGPREIHGIIRDMRKEEEQD